MKTLMGVCIFRWINGDFFFVISYIVIGNLVLCLIHKTVEADTLFTTSVRMGMAK